MLTKEVYNFHPIEQVVVTSVDFLIKIDSHLDDKYCRIP